MSSSSLRACHRLGFGYFISQNLIRLFLYRSHHVRNHDPCADRIDHLNLQRGNLRVTLLSFSVFPAMSGEPSESAATT